MAIDATPVAAEISGQIAAVVAVGVAVLLLLVAIKAYQWIRSALLGGGGGGEGDPDWRWEDEREGVFDEKGNELDRAP